MPLSPLAEAEIEERKAEIMASINALQERKDFHDDAAKELQEQIRTLQLEHSELVHPHKIGDIVADEKGVQYRVTGTGSWKNPNGLYGIRLTKEGHEAHKDPRPIWSPNLEKVEVEK